MTIELCIQNRGLGSQLTLLSFLNSTEEQYVIRCPYDAFRQLTSLKNIFSLQRDNIQIVEDNSVTDFNVFSDFAKFFCGYLSPNGLNLFGQTLYKKEHKKPCIGVACYTHTIKPFNKFELENSIEKTSFPYNKCYPIEDYQSIFGLIKQAGYDIITLDGFSHYDFETKVFLLNELCDAVIGYEGGICHLAHILEVPSFILPWHHHITSWVAFEDWKIEMQMHHLDKKTYFLNSIDELLNFSTDDFIDKIQSLKNNNGNNFILSNEVAINESFSHIKIADKIYSLLGAFSGEEKDFFTNFKTPLMVGGVNPLGRLVL